MSLTCPVDLDMLMLRREISAMYARVATAPEGEFHFHRGPAYAAGMLAYNPGELERLPAEVTARFAGVGQGTKTNCDSSANNCSCRKAHWSFDELISF